MTEYYAKIIFLNASAINTTLIMLTRNLEDFQMVLEMTQVNLGII